jgi:hypothetical protein
MSTDCYCCNCAAPPSWKSPEGTNYEVPLPRPATYQDWLTEFRDASKGAQPQLELTGAPGWWEPTRLSEWAAPLLNPLAGSNSHMSRWPSSSSRSAGSGSCGQAMKPNQLPSALMFRELCSS